MFTVRDTRFGITLLSLDASGDLGIAGYLSIPNVILTNTGGYTFFESANPIHFTNIGASSNYMTLDTSGNLVLAGGLQVGGLVNFGTEVAFNYSSKYAYLIWSGSYVLTLGADNGSPFEYIVWNGTEWVTAWFGALDVGAVYTQYINPIGNTNSVVICGYATFNQASTTTCTFTLANSLGNVFNIDSSGDVWFAGYVTSSVIPYSSSQTCGSGSYPWGGLVVTGASGTQGIYYLSVPSVASVGGLVIASNGRIGLASSSMKYKENIRSLEDCSWIYNLNAVMFDWKDKSGKDCYGLIAEEVYAVNPSMVRLKDNAPEGVYYENLPVVMLVELKKLRAEIEDLKSQIKILRGD